MSAHTIKISADTKALRDLIDRAVLAVKKFPTPGELTEELVEIDHMKVKDGELTAVFVPSDYFLAWVARLELQGERS